MTGILKVLLVSGILSSLLYVGTDLLGAMRYEGYSYTSQTISVYGSMLWFAVLAIVLLRVRYTPPARGCER